MQVGAKIGPYRVVRQLGAGGMGAMYLGEHALIGRHAAIKVLLPELSAQRQSVDRFFNEARATSGVSDPGIVQVYDFGFTPENVAFIVMEFLDGESLSARLRRSGALPAGDALRIARQVAGSLASAHAAGIVHRDLKPDNLYLVRDSEAPGGERAKILDFGIAKLSDDLTHRLVTRTGQVLGTPVYMSPEQCNGARVDHRADIYSLGCVLFQMLVGRPPFDVSGIYAVISAHLKDPPPHLGDVAPHVPDGVDAIVQKCLAKAADQRYASMTEVQQACDRVISTNHPELARVPPIVPVTSAITTAPELEPVQTTLGSTAGQPFPVKLAAPRRRVGVWIAASASAVAIGVAIALVTAHFGKRVELAPQAAVAPAIDAGIAASASMPTPTAVAPPAGPAIQPTVPAVPVDAGVAAVPPPPIDAPAAKPRPVHAPHSARQPAPSDLYDDRN